MPYSQYVLSNSTLPEFLLSKYRTNVVKNSEYTKAKKNECNALCDCHSGGFVKQTILSTKLSDQFKKKITNLNSPIHFYSISFVAIIIVDPLIHGFTFLSFNYLQWAIVRKQMNLLLTYPQKFNSSLTLGHNAFVIYLTSSHHIDISSSHIITKWKMSTVQ